MKTGNPPLYGSGYEARTGTILIWFRSVNSGNKNAGGADCGYRSFTEHEFRYIERWEIASLSKGELGLYLALISEIGQERWPALRRDAKPIKNERLNKQSNVLL